MNSALNILGYNSSIEYQQEIIHTIKSYIVKYINSDSSVSKRMIRQRMEIV